jgi:phage terminase large subunit
MAGTQTVDLGYVARPQFVPFHARQQRWGVIVAHRRAGKTVACILDLIDAAINCRRERPRFAYIAPLLKQAKSVAWDYLRSYGMRIPGARVHESELRLDLPNGAQVRLHGADNPDALRGIYLDGVVLDEAADGHPRLFNEILRPSLSDRNGWCVWIGTPKGLNDFHDLWQEARANPERFFTLMLRASQTGIIPQVELDDAYRAMTPEQFAQEFECSFQAAVIGAYYGREMQAAEDEGRIREHVYDPGLAVSTAWDLGISDETSIWFYQQAGFEVRLVDYYASHGYGLDHYVDVLQKRGYERGYKYGVHLLPHDVEVRELGTGRSRIETLRGLGLNCSVVPKLPVEDGINAVRRLLVRCWFERDHCEEGIKALRQYRREWDDIRKTFLARPCHDWTSHAADSFRYLSLGIVDMPTAIAIKRAKPRSLQWVV